MLRAERIGGTSSAIAAGGRLSDLKERAIRISYELQNLITTVAVCHHEHRTAGRARFLCVRQSGPCQREDRQKDGRFIGDNSGHQRCSLSKVD